MTAALLTTALFAAPPAFAFPPENWVLVETECRAISEDEDRSHTAKLVVVRAMTGQRGYKGDVLLLKYHAKNGSLMTSRLGLKFEVEVLAVRDTLYLWVRASDGKLAPVEDRSALHTLVAPDLTLLTCPLRERSVYTGDDEALTRRDEVRELANAMSALAHARGREQQLTLAAKFAQSKNQRLAMWAVWVTKKLSGE